MEEIFLLFLSFFLFAIKKNKMKIGQKQDKGVAGLTIMLSLVVMLFIIGLIIMIFSLMSSAILDSDSIYTRSSATAVKREAVTPNATGKAFTTAILYRSPICSAVTVYNSTSALIIGSPNYTVSDCKIKNLTDEYIDLTKWQVNYTYTNLYDTGTAGVINDTSNAIAGTTDWFDIFIVIGAMVVLILLTVIIITAIRSSGMVSEGNASGGNRNVGTA